MKIIIVTGRSRTIGNFYDTLINPIKGYFKDKNINFQTIHFADQVKKDNNNDNLYIGIFNHVPLTCMPKNYIMYVIEPLNNIDENMFNQIKNANKILVYIDFEYFKNINKNCIYYLFPYHTSIENMYNLDKNKISKIYDLIIIGTLNDKRVNLYNRLKSNNYNIYCPNIKEHPRGIFEREQDKLLYSSKIVLLNNYYKNDIQYPRMIYMLQIKFFLFIF